MIELTEREKGELLERILDRARTTRNARQRIRRILGRDWGKSYLEALERCEECEGTVEDALVILAGVRRIQRRMGGEGR